MEYEVLRYVGAGLATLGMIGAGLGLGICFSGFFNAVARQPAMEEKLKGTLMIGMALIEAIALFAFAVGMILFFVPSPFAGH